MPARRLDALSCNQRPFLCLAARWRRKAVSVADVEIISISAAERRRVGMAAGVDNMLDINMKITRARDRGE